MQTNIYVLAYI